MKRFRVIENGKEVYIQTLGIAPNNWYLGNTTTDYLNHSQYFNELLECIGKSIDDVDLVLNVTDEFSLMTLYLTEDQLLVSENIESDLLKEFPDDIEQISIKGNELNIIDIFYEFN